METAVDFENIHRAFRTKIHRYLTRLVGPAEAEDLTQEVFVKVCQGLNTFKGQSQLSTWIYRIATNLAIDKMRTPSFKQSVQSTPLNEQVEIEGKVIWIGEAALSAHQEVERQEMNSCIRGFVENLPESYRTVLVLSELEDMKNSDIAEILDITLATVKIRLHRAKEALKKELQAHCEFSRDERNEFACDLKSAFGDNA